MLAIKNHQHASLVHLPSPSVFTSNDSKQALSKDRAKFYTDITLPAFYVIGNFIPLPTSDCWVGGELKDKAFIRITIGHIAVTMPSKDEAYHGVTKRIAALLKPHVADKGYDWEFHVSETEWRLWKINGMIAPPSGSEDEKVWVEENRAVDWSG